jgi:hypothetical protein
MKVVRYADRPDLGARRHAPSSRGRRFLRTCTKAKSETNIGVVSTPTSRPSKSALVEGDELLAEAHAVPLPWDGLLDDLPSGWEDGFARGMTSAAPATAPMAIAISVAPSRQGQ